MQRILFNLDRECTPETCPFLDESTDQHLKQTLSTDCLFDSFIEIHCKNTIFKSEICLKTNTPVFSVSQISKSSLVRLFTRSHSAEFTLKSEFTLDSLFESSKKDFCQINFKWFSLKNDNSVKTSKPSYSNPELHRLVISLLHKSISKKEPLNRGKELNSHISLTKFKIEQTRLRIQSVNSKTRLFIQKITIHDNELTKKNDLLSKLAIKNTKEPPLQSPGAPIRSKIIKKTSRLLYSVSEIYHITKIQQQYSIRGLFLPESDQLRGQDKERIATALGFVASALSLVAKYLQIQLRYPLILKGSFSAIRDPLKEQQFPLFGLRDRYRFEYGVFLLNRDIQQVMDFMGIPMESLKATLLNLELIYEAIRNEQLLPV